MTSGATKVVLLSVRSPHVDRILDGTKTVEFRRRSWTVGDGTAVLLYGSRRAKAIVGSFVVDATETGSADRLWRRYGKLSGLQRKEFYAYVEGAPAVTAISVREVRTLDEPLELEELRRRRPTFHVPQSYRFIDDEELGVVLNGERALLLDDDS